ncbi:hypothetical protein, partial [Prevotella sp.]|uniref:hypothetical protein n=1 Tax=Prevotella sp. TaxID=59823 RepID=UPI0025FB23DA
SYNKASFTLQQWHYQSVKEALLLSVGAVCTAKHRKNSKTELQNEILFCNKFLPFRQYLHSGQEGY